MKKLLYVLMIFCLASPTLLANVLVNPGFETGDTTGWGPRFGSEIEAITSNPAPNSGSYCGRDFNRSQTWHGIWQSQNMLDVVEKGQTYPMSIWVRTDSATPVEVAVTMQYEPESGTVYDNIASADVGDSEWVLLEAEYTILDNDSDTATFYIEAPGSSSCEIYVDDAVFGAPETLKPHDPNAYSETTGTQNIDGTVGDIYFNSGTSAWEIHNVMLSFVAAADPNEESGIPMNPGIVKHNIYMTTFDAGPEDPNFYPIGSVSQPEITTESDPLIVFGPLGDLDLNVGTTYKWRVEEVLLDPNGIAYGDDDPNNILGPDWTFVTASAIPSIESDPDHTNTDEAGNATLSIETGPVADAYRWFIVNGEKDVWDAENGVLAPAEGDAPDDELDDTGLYSGTTTKVLTITGQASDGSQDAQYYAQAYNGDPDSGGLSTGSELSATAWVWYPRQINYYTFESSSEGPDGNEIVIDTLNTGGEYNIKLMSNDTGDDIPVIEPNFPAATGIAGNGNSLLFNNPRISDPNNADTQYAVIENGLIGGYKDLTISAWIYSKGGSNWNRILDFGNDTDNYMMLCTNTGSVNRQVRLEIKLNGTSQNVTTPSDFLPDNEWTYVTATLDGDTARIYINGELQGTNDNMTNDPVRFGPTTQNWLGRSQWGSGDGYFNGMIDELKIYNYARTIIQVGQDYLEDTEGEYVCNLDIYDQQDYDVNNNCMIDLADLAALAARWLESDRITPAE